MATEIEILGRLWQEIDRPMTKPDLFHTASVLSDLIAYCQRLERRVAKLEKADADRKGQPT